MTDTRNPKEAIGQLKVPMHLWPISATIQGCMALFLGKTKYGRTNWRATPILASVYYAALLRHAGRWWEGCDTDPEDGTPELGNCLACLAILIDAKVCGTLVDDRQFNGSNVIATFNQFNHLIPTLEAKYADKKPKHYDISDNALTVASALTPATLDKPAIAHGETAPGGQIPFSGGQP